MKFRVTNRSRQEGVISIGGKWVTLAPGEVRYSDIKPGQCTPNINVTNIATPSNEARVAQRPATSTEKTVYSEVKATTQAPRVTVIKSESEASEKKIGGKK